jgi:hypothetical protein
LRLAESKVEIPPVKTKRGPRYTPVSRRQDRPNAVMWLLRNHPELKDSQIIRLVGTTKPTIAAIRDRTHWNATNLAPQDPVTLGLCSQIDLDAEVAKASKRAAQERQAAGLPPVEPKAGTLLPTAETVPGLGPQPDISFPETADDEPTESPQAEASRVLARLNELSTGEDKAGDDD